MLTDEFFMQQALKLAQMAADEDEVPIGALVVYQDRIIGKGYNQTEKLKDITAHAEMLAITAACAVTGGKYLAECRLYVTIEPCAMCAGAIHWARPDKLVFGAYEPRSGFSKYNPGLLHKKTEWVGGILEKECQAEMRQFFEGKRNN